MEVIVTVIGIITVAQSEQLRAEVQRVLPGAHVVIVSGSRAYPPVGPSEWKSPDLGSDTTTYTWPIVWQTLP